MWQLVHHLLVKSVVERPGTAAVVGQGIPGKQGSWLRVRDRLRLEYGATTFDNWLKNIDVASLVGDALVLKAPSRFTRDWVAPRYGDRIRALWRLEDPSVNTVDFIVSESKLEQAEHSEQQPDSSGFVRAAPARGAQGRPTAQGRGRLQLTASSSSGHETGRKQGAVRAGRKGS